MDIQARKIEFVQEFLKLQSEEIISHLESFLKLEQNASITPMTKNELNNRIDASESDFENNRYKTNSALRSKYSK